VWPADGPDRDSPRTQRRGFGTRLLDEVHEEFGEGRGGGTDGDCDGDTVDYFSVGYGATPRLLRFWRRAGYRTVHLSTSP